MGSEYSSDDSEASGVDEMEDEMEHIWKLPPIWMVAEQKVMPKIRSPPEKRLLQRTAMDLAEFKREESFLHRYEAAEQREIMDRDRGIGNSPPNAFPCSFPGSQQC